MVLRLASLGLLALSLSACAGDPPRSSPSPASAPASAASSTPDPRLPNAPGQQPSGMR